MFKIFATAAVVAIADAIQLKGHADEVIPTNVTYDWNCGEQGCDPITGHPIDAAQIKLHEYVGKGVEWKKHHSVEEAVNALPTNADIDGAALAAH